MAFLTMIEEAGGREHQLEPDSTLGRAGCDVLLEDHEVSRHHAAIRSLDGAPAIEDLGSSNGTFVDDVRITGTTALADGSRVRVGQTFLRCVVSEQKTRISATPGEPEVDAPAAEAPPEPPPAPEPPEPPEPAKPAEPEPPSAIRARVPMPDTDAPPAFFAAPQAARRRGSAARNVRATVICFAVVIATAIAVVVYFAERS